MSYPAFLIPLEAGIISTDKIWKVYDWRCAERNSGGSDGRCQDHSCELLWQFARLNFV